MRLSDPIKIAYKNLLAAKFRSFLTILGIIIGIASVIIIMAIGTSAQELILDQVRSVGSNLVAVFPGASEEEGPPASAFGLTITTLKVDDLGAILKKQKAPNVVSGAAYVNGNKTVQFADKSKSTSFTGTNASYVEVENVNVSAGRFFSEEDNNNLSRVAVLGSDIAADFFGTNLDPVGKKIKIGDQSFQVIGVLESRGSAAFSNQDTAVFIPLLTAQKILLGIDYVNFIRVKIDSEENVDRAIADIKTTVREQHRIKNPEDDDFSVRDQRAGLEAISGITGAIKYFLTAIAGIALLVGGIGIMNTMLISVNERIREVGLRKALGARHSTILFQFLSESVVITLIGGIAGIILGTAVSFLAAVIIQQLGYVWPFIVTPASIILATVISFLVGIFFGLYPARHASKLNISEALRYE